MRRTRKGERSEVRLRNHWGSMGYHYWINGKGDIRKLDRKANQ